jgi:PAS domain S-box-containing protein
LNALSQATGDTAPQRQETAAPGRSAHALLLGAAILFPLAMTAAFASIAWRDAFHEARMDLDRSADAAAEYARRVLDGHRAATDRVNDLLRGLADAEIRAREAELHGVLRDLVADMPMLQTAYVGDRLGRVLLSASVMPVPRDVDLSDREFHVLLAAPQAPPVVVTRVYSGRIEANVFFAVARRRSATGNANLPPDGFDGQTNVSVDPAQVADGLRRIRADPADTLSLVRADGHVLARAGGSGMQRLPMQLPEGSPLRDAMQRGLPRGRTLHVASDGATRLGAFRQVESWPVYVAVARPRATVIGGWWHAALPQAGLGVAASTLLAVLALAVLRRQHQLAAMNAVLDRRVAERTAELAGREAEYRATFEASPVAIVQTDPVTGRFLRVNPAYCVLTGYAEAELLGGMTPADIAHPEDRDELAVRFGTLLATGTRYAGESRGIRRDGTEIWLQIAADLVRDEETGRPARAIVSVQDITERKRAEDRLLLLAREVDHRAKNLLAVVQAAVRLAPRSDPATFVQAVEGRIAALSRAQLVLAEGNWRGAELRVVAEGALAAFLARGGPPLATIEGPDVFLSAAAVQPVTLALHELATNATKYGALSLPGGRVALAWWRDPAAGMLRLRWSESGGPPVQAPSRRGFGSRVLDGTVGDQLGGRVERHWEAGGLVCELALPLRRVEGDWPYGAAEPPAG